MFRKEKKLAILGKCLGFYSSKVVQRISFCVVIVTTVQNFWMDMKPRSTFPQIGCSDRHDPENVPQQNLKAMHAHPYTW
jgi:hypothetical protein